MYGELKINKTEQTDYYTYLTLEGLFDLDGVEELRRTCEALIDQGVTRLILKMADVPFVSSSGIGFLLKWTQNLRSAGGDLVIVSPSAEVNSLIKVLYVDEVLNIVVSEEEAISGVLV